MNEANTQNQTGKESFEALALEHLDALYRHAFSLTRSKADAEDLVQEAILKAYKAFGSFKPGSNIKAWLYKILRNTFISNYRKKKAHPEIQPPDEDPDFSFFGTAVRGQRSGQVEITEEDLLNPEKLETFLGDEIVRALESLSDDYKEVIFLCDIQGLAYQEIAEIIDVPVGTVRSRLARARGILQKQLWQYAKEKGLWRSPSTLAKAKKAFAKLFGASGQSGYWRVLYK